MVATSWVELPADVWHKILLHVVVSNALMKESESIEPKEGDGRAVKGVPQIHLDNRQDSHTA